MTTETAAEAAETTGPPARRTAADQLLLDLATVWVDRYHRARVMPRGNVFDPADPREDLWRAHAAGISDAWTVLYLLGLLRTHAPAIAEHAAAFVNVGAVSIPGDRMPVFAHEWHRAVEEGRSLYGLLP